MHKKIIIAVVVTYNRKKLVKKTIDAIKNQSRKLDKIILIDNASSDGTHTELQTLGYCTDKSIEYVRMNENSGGAGGFNEGMKRALEANAEWIWVMDDDVAPEHDCLEQLLNWTYISECIHPRKYYPDGTEMKWETWLDIYSGSQTYLPCPSFRNGKQIFFTNVACFEGLLVSSRIVHTIGLPNQHYFIGHDDTLFGLKASFHTNVSVVSSAKINKLLQNNIQTPSWKDYYLTRNSFYLFKDACEYIGIQINFGHKIYFTSIRILRLLSRLIKNDARFFTSIHGLFDGCRYIFSKKISRP